MTNDPSTQQFTITQSHLLTGRGKTTLRRHIRQGKLSCTVEEGGRRWIAGSELIRVYNLKPEDFERLEAGQGAAEAPGGPDRATARHQLASVRQQLDALAEERRREREQLQAQIDHLQDALRRAQEGHNKATLLLESQSAGGELRDLVQAFTERFTDTETSRRELQKHKRLIVQLRQRNEELSRPWWRRLFA